MDPKQMAEIVGTTVRGMIDEQAQIQAGINTALESQLNALVGYVTELSEALGQIIDLMTDKLILSPKIEGLRSPPGVGEVQGRLGYPAMIGGIFMCVPAWVYDDYRYNEGNPVWGMDDVNMCNHFANKGGRVAYVMALIANHYETTDGQWARYPEYFATKIAEGLPV